MATKRRSCKYGKLKRKTKGRTCRKVRKSRKNPGQCKAYYPKNMTIMKNRIIELSKLQKSLDNKRTKLRTNQSNVTDEIKRVKNEIKIIKLNNQIINVTKKLTDLQTKFSNKRIEFSQKNSVNMAVDLEEGKKLSDQLVKIANSKGIKLTSITSNA